MSDDDDNGELDQGAGDVPIHPLFAEAEERARAEGGAPLPAPIETIDVCKFTAVLNSNTASPISPGKAATFLAWVLAGDLPDESALLEHFGPGQYQLVGRNLARSRILRRAIVRVGLYGAQHGGASPAPAPAPSPVASVAPALDAAMAMLMAEMRASRETTQQMMLAFTDASRNGALDMVKAVSALAASRVADQQGLIQALTASRGAETGGANAMEKGAELYERTLANAIAIAESLKAKGAPNEDVELVNSFIEGVKVLRTDPNTPTNVAAAAAAKNGSGN